MRLFDKPEFVILKAKPEESKSFKKILPRRNAVSENRTGAKSTNRSDSEGMKVRKNVQNDRILVLCHSEEQSDEESNNRFFTPLRFIQNDSSLALCHSEDEVRRI